MATPDSFDLEADQRTRAAWLYYMEGMTQDAVAQALGMTRARVLRILASCREDGTVQITVNAPLAASIALARRIENRFGIERVIVIPRPASDADVGALIGAATGAYVSSILTDGMTIGLGWGRTLSSSLSSLPQRAFNKLTVVSLLGGLTRASQFNPSEFAWRFADRLGAECFMMAAPVYAPDARTREALVNHAGMEDVFKHAERLDVALISVGELSPGSTLSRYGLATKEELASLARGGAVGDLLCRFIDADGALLDHPLNDRVISADPTMLRKARRIVLASGGWEKAAAVLAAIRLLKPEVLVTDETVAESLVAD
ncbi:sugar-binding transcriptional regulator [Lichenihabitans sp. Uapishka_5]|uniref:sugar-binding transcriptional regulator n=1 Tax=Lichenihabitans sp. Uapishka_5 TaxID=3037302 RepID=UPI0029E7D3D3|nr:sugar-binding transcriptional regulator [Lichenihabitans sp. Uapishka_5]MDX7952111.1 sugar-binding transcriptional regulator [Lichenihabitans sp. Uapishka_5]